MARMRGLYPPKTIATDTTLGATNPYKYGEYVITAAGVRLTLPTPNHWLQRMEYLITNASSGYAVIACSGYMMDAGNAIYLEPYQQVLVKAVKSGSTYYWATTGRFTREGNMKQLTWTPTLTWTTATPTATTVSVAYMIDGIVYWYFSTSGTDGAGATALTVTMPTRPADLNYNQAAECYQLVDTTWSDPQGYVDMLNNTAANRLLEFQAMSTCTDDKAFSIVASGWYETETGIPATWSPTTTFGTSTWDTVTTVARQINLDGIVHFVYDIRSADAKGVTSTISCTLPTGVLDLDTYIPFTGQDAVTAGDDSVDYDNNLWLLDAANATEASRVPITNAVGVMANGKAATAWMNGIYPQIGWTSWTPTFTFTGTAPTATIATGYYKVRDGMCYFNACYTTTDGNGCTALTISNLPVDPAYIGCEIALASMETVNTTDSDPLAFLACDEQANSDRTIQFKSFSTMTDAVGGYVYVAGVYPVG